MLVIAWQSWRGGDSNKARLIHISEQKSKIPLEDGSVDFINCQGVLHHTSSPQDILKEFYRVLNKDEDKERMAASIMVYNKESIWWHLYAAYYLRYVNDSLLSELPDEVKKNMSLEEIFRRSTDGVMCAKSECYNPDEFIKMCKNAGFSKIIYKGGYPDDFESGIARKYIDAALHDDRLEEEHKQFLKRVEFDQDGYPLYRGKHCCLGGVYISYYYINILKEDYKL